jgi:hypothetical protein
MSNDTWFSLMCIAIGWLNGFYLGWVIWKKRSNTMNDQELLTLAAKAAGYDYITETEGDVFAWKSRDCIEWNPLTDDGDALRLAVKLKLSLYINHAVRVDYCTPKAIPTVPLYEPLEPDVYAATRRAIVRAAAEIGKEQL